MVTGNFRIRGSF